MLHNSLLIFITSFKHKKSYQRVSPGKLDADSNHLLHLPSLTPDLLADCIQRATQISCWWNAAEPRGGERGAERILWCSSSREMKEGLKTVVCSISALHATEQRAGVLWCCPERYKTYPALARDGKNTALGAGHLLLPMGAVTDGDSFQGNFIKPTFYWFAFRALVTWELALLRPSDAQIVYFPQWNGF